MLSTLAIVYVTGYLVDLYLIYNVRSDIDDGYRVHDEADESLHVTPHRVIPRAYLEALCWPQDLMIVLIILTFPLYAWVTGRKR